MHVFIWEFRVAAGAATAFEEAYGPDGAWAELFGKAEGYAGTELLRDPVDPGRYLTIDRWRARGDFDRFLDRFHQPYDELDRACEGMNLQETKLGEFAAVP